MSLPIGRRIAVDFGQTRSGIATSDPLGLIATPLETLPTETLIARIRQLADDEFVLTIYIGLPAHLSGEEGASAKSARDFAKELARLKIAQVQLVDERLTTKSAHDSKELVERFGVDAVAAAKILEFALAGEASKGERFGEAIDGS